MESGNIVFFTCNIMVVSSPKTLCDQTLRILPLEDVCSSVPLGLSAVETQTFLAVIQHGLHSNKILALRKVTGYWLGQEVTVILWSCGNSSTDHCLIRSIPFCLFLPSLNSYSLLRKRFLTDFFLSFFQQVRSSRGCSHNECQPISSTCSTIWAEPAHLPRVSSVQLWWATRTCSTCCSLWGLQWPSARLSADTSPRYVSRFLQEMSSLQVRLYCSDEAA